MTLHSNCQNHLRLGNRKLHLSQQNISNFVAIAAYIMFVLNLQCNAFYLFNNRNNIIFRQKNLNNVYVRSTRSIDTRKQIVIDEFSEVEPIRARDVRFISPLLEYGYKPAVDECIALKEQQKQRQQSKRTSNITATLLKKPLLLFLPGFDGTFLSPFLQFPELQTSFDVRCMVVSTKDRSTYDELLENVITFLRIEIHGEKQIFHNDSFSLSNNGNMSFSTDSDNKNDSISTTVGTNSTLIYKDLNVFIGDKNISSSNQWSDMVQSTSSFFGSIVKVVVSTTSNPNLFEDRSVYLVGESFGGILASDVAINILNNNSKKTKSNKHINLQGLVLINSATCYDRSRLAVEGQKVAKMPKWLYPFCVLSLLPLFTDNFSFQQLLAILQGRSLPSIIDNEIREAYMGRVAFSLPFKIPFITQNVLQWRLSNWLATGCDKMATKNQLSALRTKYLSFRTLIIAGEDDRCLPSIAEAQRLSAVLPNSVVHIVAGAGHSSTCGSRVDLAALIRNRFPELRNGPTEFNQKKGTTSDKNNKKVLRTSMKVTAACNSGVLFGMEPRYDNKTIGLSPLLYWNEKYYKKFKP
jgi:pimeloyl-ACP methyl ester carboxylesterase